MRAPRLVRAASVLALAVSLGAVMLGTVGQEAASAAPRSLPHNLRFGGLTLLNGWHSMASSDDSGNPRVAKDSNGIVYLAGSMAGGSEENCFDLPVADRPTHNLYLAAYSNDGTPAVMLIESDGYTEVYDGDTTGYTNLSGISFPGPANTALPVTNLKLQNGWSSEQSVYSTGAPGFSRSPNGIVYLQGSMAAGRTGQTAFTLPAGDRPAKVDDILVYTSGGSVGTLKVMPSGAVEMLGASASDYTSLAGVSFPSSSAGGLTTTTMTFEHGWHYNSSFGTGTPTAARSAGGVVYLSGSMTGGSYDNVTFTLPPTDRPTHELYMPVWTSGGKQGAIEIDPSGTVYIWHGDSLPQTSLAGMSFSVTS